MSDGGAGAARRGVGVRPGGLLRAARARARLVAPRRRTGGRRGRRRRVAARARESADARAVHPRTRAHRRLRPAHRGATCAVPRSGGERADRAERRSRRRRRRAARRPPRADRIARRRPRGDRLVPPRRRPRQPPGCRGAGGGAAPPGAGGARPAGRARRPTRSVRAALRARRRPPPGPARWLSPDAPAGGRSGASARVSTISWSPPPPSTPAGSSAPPARATPIASRLLRDALVVESGSDGDAGPAAVQPQRRADVRRRLRGAAARCPTRPWPSPGPTELPTTCSTSSACATARCGRPRDSPLVSRWPTSCARSPTSWGVTSCATSLPGARSRRRWSPATSPSPTTCSPSRSRSPRSRRPSCRTCASARRCGPPSPGTSRRAERCISEAFEAAAIAGEPDAYTFYFSQLASLRYHQGRMDELTTTFAAAVDATPGLPVAARRPRVDPPRGRPSRRRRRRRRRARPTLARPSATN